MDLSAISFDSLSAMTAGLSDQCVGIEIPLSSSVAEYEFGDHSTVTDRGIRETWWRCWIVGGEAAWTEYFALVWRETTGLTIPASPDLTPSAIKQEMVLVRGNAIFPEFVLRSPRDKPYGYYRWSGGATTLRAVRVMPPHVNPPAL